MNTIDNEIIDMKRNPTFGLQGVLVSGLNQLKIADMGVLRNP